MQYRFNAIRQQAQWFWRQLYPHGSILIIFGIVCAAIGATLPVLSLLDSNAKVMVLEQQLTQQTELQQQHQVRLAETELKLRIELQSQRETLSTMAQLHRDNAEMDKELAFFRSIMAPETIVDGVVVHDFVLDETNDPRRLRYQLVLTQQKVRKRYGKGKVSISIEGSLDGKAHSVDLASLDSENPKFGYSFRYFQEFSGELLLPENFVPEQFVVRLNAKQNRGSNATVFPIAQLISKESLLLLR